MDFLLVGKNVIIRKNFKGKIIMENKKNNLTWKIGGEAGFGIKSAGMMFGKIFMRAGYEVFDYTEYPSIIRGGHNTYQLLVDTRPVNSINKKIDILVALNQNTIEQNFSELNVGGVLIYDSDKAKILPAKLAKAQITGLGIPLTTLAKEAGGEVMRNVMSLGASLALIGQSLDIANKIVKENFSRKGEVVVTNNIKALKIGFDFRAIIKDPPFSTREAYFCMFPRNSFNPTILFFIYQRSIYVSAFDSTS